MVVTDANLMQINMYIQWLFAGSACRLFVIIALAKEMHSFGNFILRLQTVQITLGHFRQIFWIVNL